MFAPYYPKSSSTDGSISKMTSLVRYLAVIVSYQEGGNMVIAWNNERMLFSLRQTSWACAATAFALALIAAELVLDLFDNDDLEDRDRLSIC
ncbi:hypothetical protein ROHU_028279 [Labeo rohita]|nr:hypothetical protein ROHU_028279 [Labeo rohita]